MSNAITHEIEIAADHAEGEQFAEWLSTRGHTAYVGNTTASLVDGEPNVGGDSILNSLWDEYCNG